MLFNRGQKMNNQRLTMRQTQHDTQLLTELKEKLQENKTAIIRRAIQSFHEHEFKKDTTK